MGFNIKEEEDDKYQPVKRTYHLPYRKLIDGNLLVIGRVLTHAMAILNSARSDVGLSRVTKEQSLQVLEKRYKELEKESLQLSATAAFITPSCHIFPLGESDKLKQHHTNRHSFQPW